MEAKIWIIQKEEMERQEYLPYGVHRALQLLLQLLIQTLQLQLVLAICVF